MKTLTFKLLVALLTFLIGVGAAMPWSKFRKDPAKKFGPMSSSHFRENPVRESGREPLRYCEVARNPELYHAKVIRVRAWLAFMGGRIYVFEDCDPLTAFASLVELEGSERSRRRARNYVDEMRTDQTEFQVKKIDTVIVGRFDAEFSLGCGGPVYRIAATSIEKVSP